MPDFLGTGLVYLQTGTVEYPLGLRFPAASAVDQDDGALPYGVTVDSAAASATDADGVDVTDELVSVAATVATENGVQMVELGLDYPSASGDGRYTLEVALTLDSGAVLVFDADRIIAGDRSA